MEINQDEILNDECMGNVDLNAVIHYAISCFRGGMIHGLTHWKNVEKNGMLLARDNPEVNRRVVRLFAYLHDHQRTGDGYDNLHGPAAAEALIDISGSLLSDLSEDEFEMLYLACKIHTRQSYPTGNATIDCCLDADRLDLTRVGITPDPERMLTEKGKSLAEELW